MEKIKNFLKNNYSDIIKPSIVLLSICIIIPLALSVTNAVTTSRIANLAEKASKDAMSEVIPEGDSFQPKETGNIEYYQGFKGEELLGYIFTESAKGYGGSVSVMVSVDTEGKIMNVAILDASNETPGLGQNVTKENFYSQYSGKKDSVNVVKNGADGQNNQVNAVTGATISSRAVTNCINKALENFKNITKG